MAISGTSSANGLSRTTNLPSGSAWTFAGWWYFLGFAHGQSTPYMYSNGGDDDNRELYITTSGNMLIWDGNDDGASFAMSANTWVHLAFTFDQVTLRAYVNGVQQITNANTSAPSEAIFIGTNDTAKWCNARWAAQKVWAATLTADEIANEMRYYVPLRVANINTVSFCRDLAEAGTDYSGNGFTWTVGGTHTLVDGPPIAFMPEVANIFLPAAAAPGGDHPAMRRYGGIVYGPRRTMRGVY